MRSRIEEDLDIFVRHVKAEAISGVVLVTFGVRCSCLQGCELDKQGE